MTQSIESPESEARQAEAAITPIAPISLTDAIALIDEGLGGLTDRQLVSASEVTDLLLDVRSLITASV